MPNEFGRGDAPREERAEGLSDAEFSALMQKIDAVAPLVRGLFPTVGGSPDSGGAAAGQAGDRNREALLRALKPYLSPERRAAVDYLIRLARIGDALRALR